LWRFNQDVPEKILHASSFGLLQTLAQTKGRREGKRHGAKEQTEPVQLKSVPVEGHSGQGINEESPENRSEA
jgi:hypothetical protein